MTNGMALVIAAGACGSALGGQFTLLGSLDASDHPAIGGAPITTDGTFYQDETFGTDNPPGSAFIGLVGDALLYDSYIALDGLNANGQAAPSGIAYTANPATATLPTEFTSNALRINGAYSMPGMGIESVMKDIGNGPKDFIFFARLTVQGGSGNVSVPSVEVNINDGDGGLITLDLKAGQENAIDGGDGNFYWIEVIQQQTSFGTVNDLYVGGGLPSPSSACALGLACLGVAGRRRRGL